MAFAFVKLGCVTLSIFGPCVRVCVCVCVCACGLVNVFQLLFKVSFVFLFDFQLDRNYKSSGLENLRDELKGETMFPMLIAGRRLAPTKLTLPLRLRSIQN